MSEGFKKYNFIAEVNDEGANIIRVKEWENRDDISEPEEGIFDNEEFYYEISVYYNDDGKFDYLEIFKVGGADEDNARGGEWCEEMDDDEIQDILETIEYYDVEEEDEE